MDAKQFIVKRRRPPALDSNGYPWNGRYIVASGNLLADFRANVAAKAQGPCADRVPVQLTDGPGVKDMLSVRLGSGHPASGPVAQGHRGTADGWA
jgi:Mn-containing catalase